MDFGEDIGLELTMEHAENLIFIKQVISLRINKLSRYALCVTFKVKCFTGKQDFPFHMASSCCKQSGVQLRFNKAALLSE